MRSTKKTVSLFQSHVFKHEFFLFPVPSERLFQEIPSIFFELIGNSPQLAELYQFSSVEVNSLENRWSFLP
ncbi:hypothetical protein NIES806_11180 [Dolichospermum compactum NIES-806]|uniref:Uncharacterized protein n=1 Tax=Dolichospermum compactum NIES-806 TaxID=1973481 RepID=A0A1Z4V085_9CYAN|nr:hypothetical protein NIES806_11180 [Dolichospermum compactum NIES-806]